MRYKTRYLRIVVIGLFSLLAPGSVFADEVLPLQTLFTNVNIFNGTEDKLYENHSVLVEGNLIKAISTGEIETNGNATVIDGQGKTLMPGIIEAHGHLGLPIPPASIGTDEDWQYVALKSSVVAKEYLDHGWTTVRDAGGMVSGIKKAIDEGVIVGPRVYSSGMFISQTSGHGDFRRFGEPHPSTLTVKPFFFRYYGHLADGVPEVRRASREELRKGAVHLKLMAGGGIASTYDPLHTTQFSVEEIKAAVDAAADWGTYVMVHAYTDKAVARAVEAGVKVIEHGQLMTEDTAIEMAKKNVWLSTQVFYAITEPTAEQINAVGDVGYNKWKSVSDGTAASIKLAKKHGIKIAFGTDLWGPAMAVGIANEFIARKEFFSNIEILKQATSINGELLRLTGKLNPYPQGPIGVIEKGAYADILVVDGNPLDEIEVLTKPKENIKVIMKDGVVYKNTL
jgi:imidazolonepropionase-like amidohydrolase